MNAYKSRPRRAIKSKLQPKMAHTISKMVDRKIHANVEDKYFDFVQSYAQATAATNNVGSVLLLSAVGEDVIEGRRIGEVINAKSFEIRFDCLSYQNRSAPVPNVQTNLRVIVFQDRQIRGTGVLPLVGDILENTTAPTGYLSNYNHVAVNTKRFNILIDKLFQLDPNYQCTTATSSGNIWTVQTTQNMHKKMKLRGKIIYKTNATDTEKGNIYIMYISDQPTITSPAVNHYSRLIFEDA